MSSNMSDMRPGGRAEWWFLNVVGGGEDDAEDRVRWKQTIGCGHPY